ncbi:MAG: hypothetical protein ACFE9L_11260 [Candidatus Hodarchaeota archaeon]
MSSLFDSSPILEYLRPRGKIVCIGDTLATELKIVQDYLNEKEAIRLPILLLTTMMGSDNNCDQVVIFDSEQPLSQIHSLLNSFFLIFIFNSSEEGILKVLGTILASIEYSGSIPIFVDTGGGLTPNQSALLGECYFHFNFKMDSHRSNFLVFLDSIVSGLNPQVGFGVSFTDMIQIFGNSKSLLFGVSSSDNLTDVLENCIDQVGDKLVTAMPEEIEHLGAVFLSVISNEPLSLQKMKIITKQITRTFGKEYEIYFSNSISSHNLDYKIFLIMTDINSIDSIIPSFASIDSLNQFLSPKISINSAKEEKDLNSDNSEMSDEDEKFYVLGKIFPNSEVYIFNDGGLPLFASHRPAGQEVCLYTGLFSAIQSMSSDLIGHTPDHLTAGDKRCVFMSQGGPENSQLRGVAICSEGSEQTARNDLAISMNIVRKLLMKGEPEYAINDKAQGLFVQGFQKGTIKNVEGNIIDFQAS